MLEPNSLGEGCFDLLTSRYQFTACLVWQAGLGETGRFGGNFPKSYNYACQEQKQNETLPGIEQ
jgi:hypothetical protein